MKTLRVLKTTYAIISEKKESDFAYLLSNSFEDLEHLSKAKRFTGAGVRFLVFVYNVLSRLSVRRAEDRSSVAKHFFFAGSQNQLDSLLPTYEAICKKSEAFLVLDGECTKSHRGRYANLKLSPVLVFIVIVLTLILLPRFLVESSRKNTARPFRFHLDAFLACYFYVPYFYALLDGSRCEIAFVSNDHSPPNRSLVAVCQRLGIKTVYMQHASVSKVFPPLEFDYAFLDGVVALNVYCEIARRSNVSSGMFKDCTIFLNGQKKPVPSAPPQSTKAVICGIGFSHLDSVDFILDVTKRLAAVYEHTIVRLHPSHLKNAADSVESEIEAFSGGVSLSKGRQEPVEKFIAAIDVFFGTETSLHLEVAVTGRRCFRVGHRGQDLSDYYGYLSRGLCRRIDIETFGELNSVSIEQTLEERSAVRAFSASYGTRWFGQEGLLNAKTLEVLDMKGCNSSSLTQLGYKHSQKSENIWELSL